jgi:hypothetical protein
MVGILYPPAAGICPHQHLIWTISVAVKIGKTAGRLIIAKWENEGMVRRSITDSRKTNP